MGEIATLRTPEQSFMAKLRAASSLLSMRGYLSRLAGKTFGGDRDLYEALGYKDVLRIEDYRARYERNAMAARIVETYAKATWRGGGEVIEVEDPDRLTDFEAAWLSLDLRLKIWSKFLRGDILSGLGNYAVLLIGAPGALTSPLPQFTSPDEVLYLATYAQDDAIIKQYDENMKSPRFGHPEVYSIKRTSTIMPSREKEVHWSRVIHLADGLLDDEVNGQPRLKKVWNLLDDLEKVTGGGAEAFWLRAHQGYQFDLDKELELDADGEKELKDEVEEFVHGMRRAVRTRGVQLKVLGSEVANFDRNSDAIIAQISAGTGIPHRILTGSERGELASTQDRNNWNERVSDRRLEYAGPRIVRPLVDRLIEHGALPAPKEGYEVRWPQIINLDESERAKVANLYADINKKNGKIVIGFDEIRDVVGLTSQAAAGVKPEPVSDTGGTSELP